MASKRPFPGPPGAFQQQPPAQPRLKIGKYIVEEGEEVNELPYVRPNNRQAGAQKNAKGKPKETKETKETKEKDSKESKEMNALSQIINIQEISPDRLLSAKKIINAYNSGDIEMIKDIIHYSAVDFCEVCFSSLKHLFIGRVALFSLWVSLFEAFPNGVFRTSDSVINEKKQVYTSFLFFGTKIFPLLIDGIPFEFLSSQMSESQYIGQSASVVIDRERPIYTTAQLLAMERPPEMIFEGYIVLHMNEFCRIKRFDFSWVRKK